MMKSRKKPFIWLHIVAVFLLLSWFLPYVKNLWDFVDRVVFFSLNQSLKLHSLWAEFWGMLNSTKERPISVIAMIGCYILFIFSSKENRRQRLLHLISYITLAECFLMLSRFITHNILHIKRYSPSLKFTETTFLSELFPTLSIKDWSHSSFPGDHATVFILWAAYFWIFTPSRVFKSLSLFISLLAILPRLFAGAHWLTDIAIGSVSIALFIIAWTVYTPLLERLFHVFIYFEKALTPFRTYAKKIYQYAKKL